MEWLDKARKQPQTTKMKLALMGAATLTVIIVGTWLLAIKSATTPEDIVTTSKSDQLKPLVMIFKNAKEGWQSIRHQAAAAKAVSGTRAASEPDVIQ